MTGPAPTVGLTGSIRAAWSDASVGDLRPVDTTSDAARTLGEWAGAATAARGATAVRTVRWIRQVHGAAVVVVDQGPGPTGAPAPPAHPSVEPVFAGTGDALVATTPDTSLAVLTADCAAVALGSPEGVFAAVHAGWRGLAAGVIADTVATMRSRGATEVHGALGPCIHAECYPFAEGDLAGLAAALGAEVRGRTADGHPALDIPVAVSSALAASGVVEVAGLDRCTACTEGYFSHRRRSDAGRQALLVWSEAGPAAAPSPTAPR